jgi:hypothetical protein
MDLGGLNAPSMLANSSLHTKSIEKDEYWQGIK